MMTTMAIGDTKAVYKLKFTVRIVSRNLFEQYQPSRDAVHIGDKTR